MNRLKQASGEMISPSWLAICISFLKRCDFWHSLGKKCRNINQVHLADQTLQWNPWEFTGTDVPGTPLAEEYALHHLELVFIDS